MDDSGIRYILGIVKPHIRREHGVWVCRSRDGFQRFEGDGYNPTDALNEWLGMNPPLARRTENTPIPLRKTREQHA